MFIRYKRDVPMTEAAKPASNTPKFNNEQMITVVSRPQFCMISFVLDFISAYGSVNLAVPRRERK